jgi:fructokinase
MQKILCFGELGAYWIPRGTQTIDQLEVPLYAQFPGGAAANVAVACQRLGVSSALVGQVGFDTIGRYVKECIEKYGVDCKYLLQSDYRTPMAFLHLDTKGKRSFSFNRDNTADLNYPIGELHSEMFQDVGIFHCCSNSLTEQAIYECTLKAMQMAKAEQVITSFDVNLRLIIWPDMAQVKPRFMELMQYCDIVKLHVEEINYLRGTQSESEFLSALFDCGLKIILISDAEHPVRLYTKNHHQSLMPPKVEVVDITSAADAFSGGWLYGLLKQGIHNPSQLENACNKITPLIDAVNIAMCCGAYAVTQKGAWSAMPACSDINDLLTSIKTI